MSNERIDLTQFEGISEGSWEVRPRSRYKIATEEHYVAQVMNNRGGDLEPVAEANANAIAKLPNLIAELKRCYEEIERLNGSLYVYCEVCKEFYIHGCEHASE